MHPTKLKRLGISTARCELVRAATIRSKLSVCRPLWICLLKLSFGLDRQKQQMRSFYISAQALTFAKISKAEEFKSSCSNASSQKGLQPSSQSILSQSAKRSNDMSRRPNPSNPYDEYQQLAFHPYNVFLMLLLAGISALFLTFLGAFVYTRIQSDMQPMRIPLLFAFNSLLLLAASWAMWRAKRSFHFDDDKHYLLELKATIGLSVLFLLMQLVAWFQLFSRNIFPETDNSAAYLYLVSGLHLLHVLAGLPFLYLFFKHSRKRLSDPVSMLVYFSDPEMKLRLRLLNIYWHFLDGLWILLILFFGVQGWWFKS